MAAQPTVIITQQPLAGSVVPMELREWNTGILGCCTDISVCIQGYFCLHSLMCSVSSRLGENCCAAHVALPAVRTKLRLTHGIRGSVCDDWCCSQCCMMCVVCQMERELRFIGK
ncbi:hypothetical protein NP493_337g02058 [Ridgeia piscesae]|uniref:Uncharacterized protein n=1 Tax=Ridgeia piscesae TaxID=27915 RepID=A0AAD9L4N6_RIDPI|nr:hypothetical protein NP493_337g02058 [Ridgeia piscesae]